MPNFTLDQIKAHLMSQQQVILNNVTGVIEHQYASIFQDSRQVTDGSIFVVIHGLAHKGTDFLPQALSQGCQLVILPEADATPAQLAEISCPCLRVENTRLAFAQLAQLFHGPAPAHIAAVTGTNGKTSVAYFIQEILTLVGQRAAAIGTLGLTLHEGLRAEIGNAADLPYLTTPDSWSLQRSAAQLAAHQVAYLSLEASSHGLDQYRLDGLTPEVAIFTNLTRDHLDYHGDEQHYFAAKSRLFTDLLAADGTAILVRKDQWADRLAEMLQQAGRQIINIALPDTDVSLKQQADFELLSVAAHGQGQKMHFRHLARDYQIDVPLVGRFQAENILCALAAVSVFGQLPAELDQILPQIKGVPGRMEFAGQTPAGGSVYIDFSHTPDAVATALSAIRPHVDGKLSVIVGAGGDRDPGKRPLMGQAAAENADYVIVSDDNPRTEDPAKIRAQVAAGCPGAEVIAGRAEAIAKGCARLGPGDVLLIAGKGHENGQIIGTETIPFHDVTVAREMIAKM